MINRQYGQTLSKTIDNAVGCLIILTFSVLVVGFCMREISLVILAALSEIQMEELSVPKLLS